MKQLRRPTGAIGFVIAASLVVGGASAVVGGISAPAWATDYPTWSDVENAKKNEKAKKAQIAELETFINALETDAAARAKEALIANETYNQAAEKLQSATRVATQLTDASTAATLEAERSRVRAGAVVAQLARMSGSDMTVQLMLSPATEADDLLYRLATMSKLSESSATLLAQAKSDANIAVSIAAQADAAQKVREQLATDADAALTKAQAAADDAAAKVSTHNAAANTLYAQLAALKGTTSQIEKDYQAGVEWEKAQEAIKDPPTPTDGTGSTTTDEPNPAAVTTAIAFAKKQLGEPYVWGAMGPSGWDCSGLTKASYAAAGVYIGTHSSNNQWDYLKSKNKLVTYADVRPGDLLFYSTGGSTSGSKYHVTMYIGDGQMIEAPYPGTTVRIKPVRFGDLVPYAGRPTG